MNNLYLYQISYNSDTKPEEGSGFLELDNTENLRPDWFEYWPIRKFLMNNKLDDNALYGFFSPKFHLKTGLKYIDVVNQINNNPAADVYLFSPYFEQISMYLNVFENAHHNHPGSHWVFEEIVRIFAPEIQIENVMMTSLNTVYCNYFVAKPIFWRVWFAHCEIIFKLAESGDTEIGKALTENVAYIYDKVPLKTFVIERIASLLLYLNKWKTRSYNPIYTDQRKLLLKDDLLVLDSLKIAFNEVEHKEFLDLIQKYRIKISKN